MQDLKHQQPHVPQDCVLNLTLVRTMQDCQPTSTLDQAPEASCNLWRFSRLRQAEAIVIDSFAETVADTVLEDLQRFNLDLGLG